MWKIITEKIKSYKDHLFLKKYNCKSWEEYHLRYDPDYNIRATKVKDIYHGYPYVYCFENPNHEIYIWDLGYDGSFVVNKWCKENLNEKFRFDFLRVIKWPPNSNEWEINEIGGGDYIFFACKSPIDYTLFKLRWV
jgi:hypothetical protein